MGEVCFTNNVPVGDGANPGVLAAIKKAGSMSALAKLCKVKQPAVHYWLYAKIPAERAMQLEELTGVSRRKIRPDLYGKVEAKNGDGQGQ